MEFDYLMKIFNEEFNRLLHDEKLHKRKVKIRIIGRIEKFPKDLYEKMKKIMDMTKDYNDYIINFAMAYGGREEIIDATKKLAEKIKSGELDVSGINEESFSDSLYMKDYPDLIIRTGGDRRTSNFLPWQGTYSEWFFLDKMWPEFEKGDLIKVIDEFNARERRFGR
jgi:tritrans,polycis-undecaprenyl-diphosphate synthase [geranylgeranyl-diphosphate specific]